MIRTMISAAARVLADRKGVTAAEYAILAAGVAVVVGTAATALGTRLSGIFATVGV